MKTNKINLKIKRFSNLELKFEREINLSHLSHHQRNIVLNSDNLNLHNRKFYKTRLKKFKSKQENESQIPLKFTEKIINKKILCDIGVCMYFLERKQLKYALLKYYSLKKKIEVLKYQYKSKLKISKLNQRELVKSYAIINESLNSTANKFIKIK